MGTRLDALIKMVADGSMDLTEFTAKNDTPDNSVISDYEMFAEDNDYFLGGEVWMESGANAGTMRRVQTSSFQSYAVTIFPPFDNPVSAGDQGYIINRRGLGHHKRDYIRAINSVIVDAGKNKLVPATADVVGTFDTTTPSLFVPSTLSWVCELQYLDDNSDFRNVKSAPRLWGYGWFPDPGNPGYLAIGGEWQSYLNGRLIRLAGYKGGDTQLVLDSDETEVDAEWLVTTAIGKLQMNNPDNYGNIGPGQYMRSRADSVRAKMTTLPRANCRKIR